MSKEHEPSGHQTALSLNESRWATYLGVTIVTGASAFLSFLISAFSISKVVIQISIWTSIVCFVFVLTLVSKNRAGFAFLLSLAITPITIGLAVLYFNTESIRADVARESEQIGQSIVAKFVDPQPSLDRAIQAGSIRKATLEDIKAFRDAYLEKKYAKNSLPVPENETALSVTHVNVSRAYVVLKKFTYPSGLVNEYRVVFLVPIGVPNPSGELGHSAVYDFATLTVGCNLARTGSISC
ncbi:MAG: Uncharacterized protein FD131_1135 [Rhodocyclaceae bacterium]|nr:MAG: Uncharacterized protein FD131_1135 [Rhodocyclaceae bacterium]